MGRRPKKGRLTLQKAEDAKAAGFTDDDVYKPRQGDDGVAGGTGFLHYTPCGTYVTIASGKGDPSKDILVEVFKDGVLMKDWTFDEFRAKAEMKNGCFA